MTRILNVTPEEYSDIQQIALECVDLNGRFCDAEFQQLLYIRLAVRLWGPHKVVVRTDVPSIPWLSRNVRRIEVVP